jgi:sec-independent protein translocase protein TatC
MAARERNNYSDDLFADSRMTFGEHLEELRTHLWRAVVGFLVCLVVSLFFGREVLQFIAAPVEKQLNKFFDERVARSRDDLAAGKPDAVAMNQPREVAMEVHRGDFAALQGKDAPADGPEWMPLRLRVPPLELAIALNEAERQIGRRPGLSTLSVQEGFLAYFKVSIFSGLVIGSPWIIYQIWLFVAAGLYPHEKRFVYTYLPFSVGLFIGGVLICQFIVMPKAIEALLWFNKWTGLEPDVRFSEWLGFALLMPLVFGLSFQVPLIMLFLERIGVMTVEGYWGMWKLNFFLIHVFAAIVTPSIDPLSMEFLALPMFGLYLLGILLCKLNPREPDLDVDVPESGEQVGV